ncbi:HlyD family efflux transporter periplasmic adaptor subunit [Candidatus Weimeria sp. HCP3S3_B5]|uniref:efflux RND transporter periplasmic adaptor subunit n=1 Tax=Candidatus Weimeria sp. HCP3S3_B5 TaxID=3438871 RepID=UPI003F8C1A4A
MEKKKKMKRIIVILCIVAAVLAMLISGSIRKKARQAEKKSSSVKTVKVTKGTIANTVTASGTLAEAKTADITIPSGITVKKVLVEEGDTVKKGHALAKVDLTSVKEQIYSVRSSISDINDSLKSIKSKSGSKYTAEREMLKAQKTDLYKALKRLLKIKKSGTITASVAGTIDSVNVSGSSDASSSTSTDSSVTNNSSLSGITGTSSDSKGLVASQLTEKVVISDSSSSDGNAWSSTDDSQETYDEAGNTDGAEYSSEKPSSKKDTDSSKSSSKKDSGSKDSSSSKEKTTTGRTGNPVASGLTDSNLSALTGSASTGSTTSEGSGSSYSSSVSDVTYTTAFTIATGDMMDISLSVDELDILNIKKGQDVSVALDAIDGETFTGEITKVSKKGTNSGGSTKYTVTCQIEKTDDMLVGMNATAVITIDSAEDVLTIPLSAVQEEGGSSYVYTTNDNGSLGGKTKITTGLSNDSTVEITDGLSEGDTVYYKDLSGQELTSSQNNMSNMGNNMQKSQQGGRNDGPLGDNGGTPPSGGNGGPGGN